MLGINLQKEVKKKFCLAKNLYILFIRKKKKKINLYYRFYIRKKFIPLFIEFYILC
nr:MAG TPA: hypothetical protein [Caudoviricetes sp.]